MEMNSKGQAMIIDALFFMLLCGMSAGVLAWASSVYGNEALDAYRYLYLIDTESGAVQQLSAVSYDYNGNKLYWIDQLGRYLDGQFNESDERFKLLLKVWNRTCDMVGSPLVMEVYPEYSYRLGNTSVCNDDVCVDDEHPLIFTCKVGDTSAYESVVDYVVSHKACTGMFEDLGNRSDTLGLPNPLSHLLMFKYGDYSETSCNNVKPEPVYYASPKMIKVCHDRVCDIRTKIYY